ncbi:hypothetical protein cyc_06317 [Cyclospora cayetanensis]|uniref:Uncharacterized protein n=1 Tax=Cyclospora cayetanensis TaxID=88456 RepID=A0A1D3D3U0_9EIME|nr:hypothetical protein cyc_06317 [Cyclospora cayetanensis]
MVDVGNGTTPLGTAEAAQQAYVSAATLQLGERHDLLASAMPMNASMRLCPPERCVRGKEDKLIEDLISRLEMYLALYSPAEGKRLPFAACYLVVDALQPCAGSHPGVETSRA